MKPFLFYFCYLFLKDRKFSMRKQFIGIKRKSGTLIMSFRKEQQKTPPIKTNPSLQKELKKSPNISIFKQFIGISDKS